MSAIAEHRKMSFAVMSPKVRIPEVDLSYVYVVTERGNRQVQLSFVPWIEMQDGEAPRTMDEQKFGHMRLAFESCIRLGSSPSGENHREGIWALFTRDKHQVASSLIIADEGADEFFQFRLEPDGGLFLV